MWTKINCLDPSTNIWFAHCENNLFIYYNKGDGKWWIDGPNGKGVWIIEGPSHAPPAHGWSHVTKQMINGGGSMVRTFRKMAENNVEYSEQGEYMLLLQFRSDKVKHVHNP